MGRAAYVSKDPCLPPAAREEAEQREHENDDQDDPKDAQCSHPLRASFSRRGIPTLEGALNPFYATFTAQTGIVPSTPGSSRATRSSAETTFGQNCVPAFARISASAWWCGSFSR
jgi:hypothetical protein